MAGRGIGTAVADGNARFVVTDLEDRRAQRHHRPQRDFARDIRRGQHAIGRNAGTHHVQRVLGIENACAAVAAVADLRRDAAALHGREHLHKALKLQPREGDVLRRGRIGHGKVHEHTLDEKMLKLCDLLQLVQRFFVVIGEKAETRHAGVQLQVDAQTAAGSGQTLVEPLRVFEAVHLLPKIHSRKIQRIEGRRVAEDQHRSANAAAAKLQGLLDV